MSFTPSQHILSSNKPQLPQLSSDLRELEKWIKERESKTESLKPNNEAEIVWAKDSAYTPTIYSFLYLHGFSASKADGEPIHRNIAHRYKGNLYLARLHEHGMEKAEPLLDFSAKGLIDSALEALAIARHLGERVVIISTSTGSTLALWLASHFPDIHSLICYSPNIELYAKSSRLLTFPFGLNIARLVMGGKYRITSQQPETVKYWNTRYRLEALIQLKILLDDTMKAETFMQVKCPVFVGYFYKNEEEHDKTVSVPAILQMFEELATPSELKHIENFPDAGVHCISSKYENKNWKLVQEATFAFLDSLFMKAI